MSWHYSNDGKQCGPITDAEFEASVKSGVIHTDTLVWKEGLAQWTKYGELEREGNTATMTLAQAGHCAECGKEFAQDEMANFGGAWVCADCKPQYVQKIKEGVNVGGEVTYAGFWIRFCAKIVDNILVRLVAGAAGIVIGLVMRGQGTAAAIVGGLVGGAIGIGYTVFFLGKFGATPGKMAIKVKVLRPNGEPISYMRALGRAFAEILSGVLLGIGFLMAAWDPEKRTLHDRICDTRVVKQ